MAEEANQQSIDLTVQQLVSHLVEAPKLVEEDAPMKRQLIATTSFATQQPQDPAWLARQHKAADENSHVNHRKLNQLHRRCSLPGTNTSSSNILKTRHPASQRFTLAAETSSRLRRAARTTPLSAKKHGTSSVKQSSRKRSRHSLGCVPMTSEGRTLLLEVSKENDESHSVTLSCAPRNSSAQLMVIRESIEPYPSMMHAVAPPQFPPMTAHTTPSNRHHCNQPSHSVARTNQVAAAPAPPTPTMSPFSSPSFDQVEAIRKAVREYTLLPKEKRSSDCDPALFIRALTGYVLAPPISASTLSTNHDSATAGLLGSPSVKTRASKADVLNKLGGEDVFRELDACKVRDANIALQATQCRPEKDRGSYRYVHVPTGTEITPQAYEERYMFMLNKVCGLKWHYWKNYFDRLKQHAHVQHRKATSTPSSVPSGGQGTRSSASSRVPSTTPTTLLPLPSRDESSSDPEIAAVEQDLWDKIDVALEEYSQKVLEIQERRRRVQER